MTDPDFDAKLRAWEDLNLERGTYDPDEFERDDEADEADTVEPDDDDYDDQAADDWELWRERE